MIDYTRLRKRAEQYAVNRKKADVAEDFGSYFLMSVDFKKLDQLEKDQNGDVVILFKWYFTDFLRKEFGERRTGSGKARSEARNFSCSYDDHSELIEDVEGQRAIEAFEASPIERKVTRVPGKKRIPREAWPVYASPAKLTEVKLAPPDQDEIQKWRGGTMLKREPTPMEIKRRRMKLR
jgi:hypothetical protein